MSNTLRKFEEANELFRKIDELIIEKKSVVAQHRLFTSDCPVYTYAPTWYTPNKRISNCEKAITLHLFSKVFTSVK